MAAAVELLIGTKILRSSYVTIWLTGTNYPHLKWQWIFSHLRRCFLSCIIGQSFLYHRPVFPVSSASLSCIIGQSFLYHRPVFPVSSASLSCIIGQSFLYHRPVFPVSSASLSPNLTI